jgi:hypothetical protein
MKFEEGITTPAKEPVESSAPVKSVFGSKAVPFQKKGVGSPFVKN